MMEKQGLSRKKIVRNGLNGYNEPRYDEYWELEGRWTRTHGVHSLTSLHSFTSWHRRIEAFGDDPYAGIYEERKR